MYWTRPSTRDQGAPRAPLEQRHQRWVRAVFLPEARDEVETWSQEREDGAILAVLYVTAGKRIGDRVRRTRLVLNGEVEAKQLPHPMVLGNRREPLVHQILQAVVVRLHQKAVTPEVRPPGRTA